MLKLKVVTTFVLALTTVTSAGCSIKKPTVIENKSTIKAQELSSPVDKINTANNKVAFKFLDESSKASTNNNIAISPLSLGTVLALAQNGTSGKTKEEILKALELQGYSDTEINENYKKVIAHFNSLSNIEMKLGNSVWVTKDAKISDEFKSTGKSYYDAEANEVDFSKKQTADIINKWIDNQTAGKIKKIVDSFDKNTFMALINTVYFKAKWANQFMPQNTTKQKFTLSDGTTQDVDMMKKTM
jgi:serpin B